MKKYQVRIKLKEGIKDIAAETLITFIKESEGIGNIKTGSIYYIEARSITDVEQFVKEYLISEQLDEYQIVEDEVVDYNSDEYVAYI
jgi:phosphoribosylformylglycinamidine (FGAM) synthase PurS component